MAFYCILELNTAYRGCLAWSWYGYGVSDLLDMAYRAPPVRCILLLGYGVLSYSGTVYCTSWVRLIELPGYGVLSFLGTDQAMVLSSSKYLDTALKIGYGVTDAFGYAVTMTWQVYAVTDVFGYGVMDVVIS
ncbi:hypothetical protein Tco_0677632 [Tanacetum coccineum]|uniref:Uncharacterized protein n=1 Tax=Tanacetum coccineum TaxID=301880 RepID=A0ABQ4XDM3_9ASTR